ncbi:addiction module toxin RelE [Spirochaetia bacterium]|nr:addiction module toxin RelE [Spirochaetia bacterium]
MRVFKNRWFCRFAETESISDSELKAVIQQIDSGQSVSDLGGGVYKVRIARPGAGKSGGYRIIVFFKSGFRSFFVYGFAKSDRDNINQKQLQDFKTVAKTTFAYTDKQLDELVKTNWFCEI